MSAVAINLRWLVAIHDATQALCNDARTDTHAVAKIINSLEYLLNLEAMLLRFEKEWGLPPTLDPPTFAPLFLADEEPSSERNNISTDNSYAVLGETEDEEDEERDDMSPRSRGSLSTTGPYSLSQRSRDGNSDAIRGSLWGNAETVVGGDSLQTDIKPLSTRRILIRIFTAQSEMFASLARSNRRVQRWADGARNCQASLEKLHQGLCLARSTTGTKSQNDMAALLEDASIVEVAVETLTVQRDSLLRRALDKKRRLTLQLERSREKRRLIKEMMGERWYRPRSGGNSDEAKIRSKVEEQLYDLVNVVGRLVKCDPRPMMTETRMLRMQLECITPCHRPIVCPNNNQQHTPALNSESFFSKPIK